MFTEDNIPTPQDLMAKREYAQSMLGTMERIVRVIEERPDIDSYKFQIKSYAVASIICDYFVNQGWQAYPLVSEEFGTYQDQIEISWP